MQHHYMFVLCPQASSRQVDRDHLIHRGKSTNTCHHVTDDIMGHMVIPAGYDGLMYLAAFAP